MQRSAPWRLRTCKRQAYRDVVEVPRMKPSPLGLLFRASDVAPDMPRAWGLQIAVPGLVPIAGKSFEW